MQLVKDVSLSTENCIRGIKYYPPLDVLCVNLNNSKLLFIEASSGNVVKRYDASNIPRSNASGDADVPICLGVFPYKERFMISKGCLFNARIDTNGTLLVDSILQPPIAKPSDVVVIDLPCSEANYFLKLLQTDATQWEQSEALGVSICQPLVTSKSSLKLSKWEPVVITSPHSVLSSWVSHIFENLPSLNLPGIPVLAAVQDRLNNLTFTEEEVRDSAIGRVKSFMNVEAHRRLSFAVWPHMNYKWALPDLMAQAGFFHRPQAIEGDDRALCFTCDICLISWEPTDEPWSEHQRHSPTCPFIKNEYTNNIPIAVTYATEPARLHTLTSDPITVLSSTNSKEFVATSTASGHISIWDVSLLNRRAAEFRLSNCMPAGTSDLVVDTACLLEWNTEKPQQRQNRRSGRKESTANHEPGPGSHLLILGVRLRQPDDSAIKPYLVVLEVSPQTSQQMMELSELKLPSGGGLGQMGGSGLDMLDVPPVDYDGEDDEDEDMDVDMIGDDTMDQPPLMDQQWVPPTYDEAVEELSKTRFYKALGLADLWEIVAGSDAKSEHPTADDDQQQQEPSQKTTVTNMYQWLPMSAAPWTGPRGGQGENSGQRRGTTTTVDYGGMRRFCQLIGFPMLEEGERSGSRVVTLLPTLTLTGRSAVLVGVAPTNQPESSSLCGQKTGGIFLYNCRSPGDSNPMEASPLLSVLLTAADSPRTICLTDIDLGEGSSSSDGDITDSGGSDRDDVLLQTDESASNATEPQAMLGPWLLLTLEGAVRLYNPNEPHLLANAKTLLTIGQQLETEEGRYVCMEYCPGMDRVCLATETGHVSFHRIERRETEVVVLAGSGPLSVSVALPAPLALPEEDEITSTTGVQQQPLDLRVFPRPTTAVVGSGPNTAANAGTANPPIKLLPPPPAAMTEMDLLANSPTCISHQLPTLHDLVQYEPLMARVNASLPAWWTELPPDQITRQSPHMGVSPNPVLPTGVTCTPMVVPGGGSATVSSSTPGGMIDRGGIRQTYYCTKAWKLVPYLGTWEEHVIELALPKVVCLGHIDVKIVFADLQGAPVPPIYVTLLRQNMSTASTSVLAMDSVWGTIRSGAGAGVVSTQSYGAGSEEEAMVAASAAAFFQSQHAVENGLTILDLDAPYMDDDQLKHSGGRHGPGVGTTASGCSSRFSGDVCPVSEEQLRQLDADIVAGPYYLPDYVDLSGQAAVIPMTSAELIKCRSRLFAVHIKAMVPRPPKEYTDRVSNDGKDGNPLIHAISQHQGRHKSGSMGGAGSSIPVLSSSGHLGASSSSSKSRRASGGVSDPQLQAVVLTPPWYGCDVIRQLSLTVRKFRRVPGVPMERAQRLAILRSEQLHRQLMGALTGSGAVSPSPQLPGPHVRHLVLDLLNWIISMYQNELNTRSKRIHDLLGLATNHVDDLVVALILGGDRSVVKKAARLLISFLELERAAHERTANQHQKYTFHRALHEVLQQRLRAVVVVESAAGLHWYFLLLDRLDAELGTNESTMAKTQLLRELAAVYRDRNSSIEASILRSVFGLFHNPLEASLFDLHSQWNLNCSRDSIGSATGLRTTSQTGPKSYAQIVAQHMASAGGVGAASSSSSGIFPPMGMTGVTGTGLDKSLGEQAAAAASTAAAASGNSSSMATGASGAGAPSSLVSGVTVASNMIGDLVKMIGQLSGLATSLASAAAAAAVASAGAKMSTSTSTTAAHSQHAMGCAVPAATAGRQQGGYILEDLFTWQLRELIEVEPLHLICDSTSEGTRLEKLDMQSGAISLVPSQSNQPTFQQAKASYYHPWDMPAVPFIAMPSVIPPPPPLMGAGPIHKHLKIKHQLMKMNQFKKYIMEGKMWEGGLASGVNAMVGGGGGVSGVASVGAGTSLGIKKESSASPTAPLTPKTTPAATTQTTPRQCTPSVSPPNEMATGFSAGPSTSATATAPPTARSPQRPVPLNPDIMNHFLDTPEAYQLVVERMHSGARRYTVLSFGAPVLLTDLVVPACPDLASLTVDVALTNTDESEFQTLAYTTDIGTRPLVLTDLQPPLICQYVKITIVGRMGCTSSKAKIPIGGFYGHAVILPWEVELSVGSTGRGVGGAMTGGVSLTSGHQHHYHTHHHHSSGGTGGGSVAGGGGAGSTSRHRSGSGGSNATESGVGAAYAKLVSVLNQLRSVTENLMCHYGLARSNLVRLLDAYRNPNSTLAPARGADLHAQILIAYEQCCSLQRQLNVVHRASARIGSAISMEIVNGSKVDQRLEDRERVISQASTDKVRLLIEYCLQSLLGQLVPSNYPYHPLAPSNSEAAGPVDKPISTQEQALMLLNPWEQLLTNSDLLVALRPNQMEQMFVGLIVFGNKSMQVMSTALLSHTCVLATISGHLDLRQWWSSWLHRMLTCYFTSKPLPLPPTQSDTDSPAQSPPPQSPTVLVPRHRIFLLLCVLIQRLVLSGLGRMISEDILSLLDHLLRPLAQSSRPPVIDQELLNWTLLLTNTTLDCVAREVGSANAAASQDARGASGGNRWAFLSWHHAQATRGGGAGGEDGGVMASVGLAAATGAVGGAAMDHSRMDVKGLAKRLHHHKQKLLDIKKAREEFMNAQVRAQSDNQKSKAAKKWILKKKEDEFNRQMKMLTQKHVKDLMNMKKNEVDLCRRLEKRLGPLTTPHLHQADQPVPPPQRDLPSTCSPSPCPALVPSGHVRLVVRGLFTLLARVDCTVNSDLFLRTCKVISRLMTTSQPALGLPETITAGQMYTLLERACLPAFTTNLSGSEQSSGGMGHAAYFAGHYGLHALTCLLTDLLEAEVNGGDNGRRADSALGRFPAKPTVDLGFGQEDDVGDQDEEVDDDENDDDDDDEEEEGVVKMIPGPDSTSLGAGGASGSTTSEIYLDDFPALPLGSTGVGGPLGSGGGAAQGDSDSDSDMETPPPDPLLDEICLVGAGPGHLTPMTFLPTTSSAAGSTATTTTAGGGGVVSGMGVGSGLHRWPGLESLSLDTMSGGSGPGGPLPGLPPGITAAYDLRAEEGLGLRSDWLMRRWAAQLMVRAEGAVGAACAPADPEAVAREEERDRQDADTMETDEGDEFSSRNAAELVENCLNNLLVNMEARQLRLEPILQLYLGLNQDSVNQWSMTSNPPLLSLTRAAVEALLTHLCTSHQLATIHLSLRCLVLVCHQRAPTAVAQRMPDFLLASPLFRRFCLHLLCSPTQAFAGAAGSLAGQVGLESGPPTVGPTVLAAFEDLISRLRMYCADLETLFIPFLADLLVEMLQENGPLPLCYGPRDLQCQLILQASHESFESCEPRVRLGLIYAISRLVLQHMANPVQYQVRTTLAGYADRFTCFTSLVPLGETVGLLREDPERCYQSLCCRDRSMSALISLLKQLLQQSPPGGQVSMTTDDQKEVERTNSNSSASQQLPPSLADVLVENGEPIRHLLSCLNCCRSSIHLDLGLPGSGSPHSEEGTNSSPTTEPPGPPLLAELAGELFEHLQPVSVGDWVLVALKHIYLSVSPAHRSAFIDLLLDALRSPFTELHDPLLIFVVWVLSFNSGKDVGPSTCPPLQYFIQQGGIQILCDQVLASCRHVLGSGPSLLPATEAALALAFSALTGHLGSVGSGAGEPTIAAGMETKHGGKGAKSSSTAAKTGDIPPFFTWQQQAQQPHQYILYHMPGSKTAASGFPPGSTVGSASNMGSDLSPAKDGLVNFAPYSQISIGPDGSGVSGPEVLLAPPGKYQRRSKPTSWSYNFFPDDTYVELIISLPCVVLLREVVIVPHAGSIQSCPSAVSIEFHRENSIVQPLSAPISTAGLTTIHVTFPATLANRVLIRLHRPRDSETLSLTQIKVRGTALSCSSESSGGGLVSLTRLRLLDFILQSATDDLTEPVIAGFVDSQPNLVPYLCALLTKQSSDASIVEQILVSLGSKSPAASKRILQCLLKAPTTPNLDAIFYRAEHLEANPSTENLIYCLAVQLDAHTGDRLALMLDWLAELTNSESARRVTAFAQARHLYTLAAVLWHWANRSWPAVATGAWQEKLTSELLNSVLNWAATVPAENSRTRSALACLACALCAVRPALLDSLLNWALLPQMTTTRSMTDDCKSERQQAAGGQGAGTLHNHLESLCPHLDILATGLQTEHNLRQLIATSFLDLVVGQLLEFFTNHLHILSVDSDQMQPPPQQQPPTTPGSAAANFTDSSKKAAAWLNFPPDLSCLPVAAVTSLLHFLANLADADTEIREWLGRPEATHFWAPMITLLNCSNLAGLPDCPKPSKMPRNNKIQPLGLSDRLDLEAAGVAFFQAVTKFSEENQAKFAHLIYETLQVLKDSQDSLGLPDFLRRLLLQVVLVESSVRLRLRTNQTGLFRCAQPSSELDQGGSYLHPRYGAGDSYLMRTVSANMPLSMLAQEIIEMNGGAGVSANSSVGGAQHGAAASKATTAGSDTEEVMIMGGVPGSSYASSSAASAAAHGIESSGLGVGVPSVKLGSKLSSTTYGLKLVDALSGLVTRRKISGAGTSSAAGASTEMADESINSTGPTRAVLAVTEVIFYQDELQAYIPLNCTVGQLIYALIRAGDLFRGHVPLAVNLHQHRDGQSQTQQPPMPLLPLADCPPVPSLLETFIGIGGLVLLAEMLPLLYPGIRRMCQGGATGSPLNTASKPAMSSSLAGAVGSSHAPGFPPSQSTFQSYWSEFPEEFYDIDFDLDPLAHANELYLPHRRQQAGSGTRPNLPVLPAHSLISFALFLRLPGYAELLIREWEEARHLLRLLLGFSTDEFGQNFLSRDSDLPLVPYRILRRLYASQPRGTDDAAFLRVRSLDLGILDLCLNCLAVLSHMSPTQGVSSGGAANAIIIKWTVEDLQAQLQTCVGGGGAAAAGAAGAASSTTGAMGAGGSSSHYIFPLHQSQQQAGSQQQDDKKLYWAKGTGFGTGSVFSTWDSEYTIQRQKLEEDHCTVILEALAAFLCPCDDDQTNQEEVETETDPSYYVEFLPSPAVHQLRSSCLLDLMASYLRNDSVLDMARHVPVYQALLAVLRSIARLPELGPLLLPQDSPRGSYLNIAQLLASMKTCVDTYANRLRKAPAAANKKSNKNRLKRQFSIRRGYGGGVDPPLGGVGGGNLYSKMSSQHKLGGCSKRVEDPTGAGQDNDESENLAQLIPDIQRTARLVDRTLHRAAMAAAATANRHHQENMEHGGCYYSSSFMGARNADGIYCEVMKPLQFGMWEMVRELPDGTISHFLVPHHYESFIRQPVGSESGAGGASGNRAVGGGAGSAAGSQSAAARARRLAQETVTLSTSLPLSSGSTVFARCDDNRLDLMKILIVGPPDTPYANGCFEFDVYFPPDYPTAPPMVNLQTTGSHSIRFNPNLYNEGKVCLSILNTWHGRPEERWNPKTSSFLQVLVSIQSLILVPEPYFNEPGYERSRGTAAGAQASRDYNANIRAATAKWAMLEQVRNPPVAFKEVILKHYQLKKDEVIAQVNEWITEMSASANDKTVTKSTIQHSLAQLKKTFAQLKEELAKLDQKASTSSPLPATLSAGTSQSTPAPSLPPEPAPAPAPVHAAVLAGSSSVTTGTTTAGSEPTDLSIGASAAAAAAASDKDKLSWFQPL